MSEPMELPATTGSGAVEPTPTVIRFRGWLTYDPADPDHYPTLTVAPVGGSYVPSKPAHFSDSHVVRRVTVEVRL